MSPGTLDRLTPSEEEELLTAAWGVLRSRLLGGAGPGEMAGHRRLREPGMAFVTLRKSKELRGCIGNLATDSSLYLTVIDCAWSAASRDPRFPPVSADELSELTLSISVLGEFRAIHDPGEIEIGRHGLLIEKMGRRGVLLPEVAAEMRLSPESFLELVCKKAQLPPGAWKDADVHIFTSQVFSTESP